MDVVNDIQEGFLCPICIKDLGDFIQLQQHVADFHSQSDNDAIFAIKGLFDKAKQRWLKFDLGREIGAEIPAYESPESVSFWEPTYTEPQEIGVSHSHTAYFKKVRDSRIDDFAVETNKLIIRLDKLINCAPDDPSKRKAFEKDVIPWVNDSEVQHCRFCGCKFSLAKRKHHCRLCGKIICGSCSQFLTFAYARKLTNPAFALSYHAEIERQKSVPSVQSKQPSPNLNLKQAERLIKSGLSKLKFDNSEVSVNSLFSQEGEEHLRICTDCKNLLEKRDQQMEQRTHAPIFVQMYDRLRLLMEEAERMIPSYCKMAESLNTGESLYDLQTAKALRVKLAKLQEQIDFVSKKVGQFGLNPESDNENHDSSYPSTSVAPSAKQLTVQKNVQMFAATFLRDMVLSLPNLPQDDVYAALQEKYKAGIENKIQKERSAANVAMLRANSTRDSNVLQLSPSRSLPQQKLFWKSDEGGWTPSKAALASALSSMSFSTDDSKPLDPICEQIVQIKEYIRQAAADGRLDEIGILKRNLFELESELKRQRSSDSAV